jgi:hypothetical protein
MGQGKDVMKWIRKAFANCFTVSLRGPKHRFRVAIVDFMMYLKYIPVGIVSMDDLIRYFVERVAYYVNSKEWSFTTVIVMVDGAPYDVKRIVEHKKRGYDKGHVISSEGPPAFPARLNEKCPFDSKTWKNFTSNQERVRRELLPRLFNAIMACRYFVPDCGKTIILSGFPGRTRWVEQTSGLPVWEKPLIGGSYQPQVVTWDEAQELPITPEVEQEQPDLYFRAFRLEHIPPCEKFPQGRLMALELDEFKHPNITETDNRMFWIMRDYLMTGQNIMCFLNDKDFIPIGVMHMLEYQNVFPVGGGLISPLEALHDQHQGTGNGEPRTAPLQFQFPAEVVACFPDKRGIAKEMLEVNCPREFFYLHTFFNELHTHYEFEDGKKQIQSIVASFVFICIMDGTDFFKDFMKNIGWQTCKEVFFENLPLFGNMVLMSQTAPSDPRGHRHLELDEDAFLLYVDFVYLKKWEPTVLRDMLPAKPEKISRTQLRQRLENQGGQRADDPKARLPDRNTRRKWARQILFNMLYWEAEPKGRHVNHFETWQGKPVFPYWNKPELQLLNAVSRERAPCDEVFERMKLKNRKRERPTSSLLNQTK